MTTVSGVSLRFENRPTKRGAIVIVNDSVDVDIAVSQFEFLLRLVYCRLYKQGGYATVRDLDAEPTLIHQRATRLRLNLNTQVYAGFGRAVITSIGHGCYQLQVEPDAMSVSSDFCRLAQLMVPSSVWEKIVDYFRKRRPEP